jgi:hypothetical protein
VTIRRLLPGIVFVTIFVAHVLYSCSVVAAAPSGWNSYDVSWNEDQLRGLGTYWRGQDYFIGFSYALGGAFATWALSHCVFPGQARRAAAGAAAGSLTLVGVLMAGSCFLIGCCGSPMLAVYIALFGAQAVGIGKPLTAFVTLASVGCGYWCLSRRLARGSVCSDTCCSAPATAEIDRSKVVPTRYDKNGWRQGTGYGPPKRRH